MVVEWTDAAYAKVNAALLVGACRSDGYHPVATVIQRLELHDRVEIRVERRRKGELEIEATADVAGVPSGEKNLAWKAAMSLAPQLEAAGYGNARVEIRLEKQIPIAAGLAGGSADAASVLAGLNRRLALGIGEEELMAKAAELGSDVPACLIEGTTLCTGRGEQVRAIASPRLWWVLANPQGGLAVGDVYREYDTLQEANGESPRAPQELEQDIAPVVEAFAQGDAARVARVLRNDLQEAASRLHAGIAPLLAKMKEQGALGALVSGSGPTVAGLAPDAACARRIAEALAKGGNWVWWGAGLAS